MSLSNNTEVINPAVRFFEWAGSEGTLSYYDKEAKQKVNVSLPFTFILLDELSIIKGYSNDDEKGIFSNEVRDTTKDILNVRIFGVGTIAKGLYKDIKDSVVAKGGKYGKSCYIAFFDDNKQLKIGNIQLSGSSFGGGENKKEGYTVDAWIGFDKAHRAEKYKKAIVMEKDERVCINGATKFFCPKFSVKDVKDETRNVAIELDKELQEYLTAYFKRQNTSNESEEVKPEAEAQPVAENVFAKKNSETAQPQKQSEPSHIPDNTDDDLPF